MLYRFDFVGRCDPNHISSPNNEFTIRECSEKVQAGNDQEKAQSEKDSHSKTEVGKT